MTNENEQERKKPLSLAGRGKLELKRPVSGDPGQASVRQSFPHVALNGRVSPRSARIVNTNRRIGGQRAVEIARRILCYFTKWHAHARQFTVDVNATRVWQ